jgi:hypothetical protein
LISACLFNEAMAKYIKIYNGRNISVPEDTSETC